MKLTDALWNNKEWLFSSLGIALVVLFWRVVQWFRVKPSDSSNSTQSDTAPKTTSAPISQQTFNLTPKYIVDTIQAAPPFSRSLTANHFVGNYVEWELTLRSIFPRDDGSAGLVFRPLNRDYITIRCSVDVKASPFVKVIREESILLVKGRIAEADEFEIKLADVNLVVLKPKN